MRMLSAQKIGSILLGLWALAAWAGPLPPAEEEASAPPVENTGPRLTKSPALLEAAPAAFPPEMEAEQQSGTVILELEIDEEGNVRNVVVLESAGPAFDKAASKAAWKYRFSPAEVDDKPAPVRIHYRSEFSFRPPEETLPETLQDSALGEFFGELVERGTRLPITEALVVLSEGDAAYETFSDEDGRFSFLELPPGVWKLSVSSPRHEHLLSEETIASGKRTQARYYIKQKTYGAFQTTVHGTKDKREVSQVTLQQEEIRLIPGTQGDAFKVVLNLPGVARMPFGMGMLVVRGARPNDTRTYIDDVQIPLLFHFGGLFATVNSSLLERLDFEPGNFGVAFGRSMGGLVKGNIRSPSPSGLHGYADISISGASALVEGPVGKGWSVLASGQRSYLDAVLHFAMKSVAEDQLQFHVAPRFYNYQLRAEHRSEEKNSRFFAFIFGADDKIKLLMPNATVDPEGRNAIGNATRYDRIALGWERRFSDKLFFKTRNSLGYEAVTLSMGDISFNGKQYPITSRNEFSFTLGENTTLRVGADLSYKPVSYDVRAPGWNRVGQMYNPLLSSQLISEKKTDHHFEPAVYAEIQRNFFKGFQVVGGLRVDYNSHIGKAWVDPRLAISQSFAERLKLKGAVGLFQQPPDYMNGQTTAAFGNPNLRHESSVHSSVGLEAKLTQAINAELQFYHRHGFNISRQTVGANTQDSLNAEDSFPMDNAGTSRAYGMEFLLRHQLTDRFFGWIAYSLSRTQVNDLLHGGYRRSPFDQPHNLIVVASYRLPWEFIVGGRFRYSSGSPTTPVVGTVYDANGGYYSPLYGRRNSARMPDFFQLDLRIDKRFVFKQWMLSCYLDIQNVTFRKNPEMINYNYDYTERAYISLPFLPVLGLRAEF